MSHHGQKPFDVYDDDTADRMRELIKESFLHSRLGATGTHPDGKLTKSDEGEIAFAVGVKNGKVVLDFGSPVAWIGMDAGQAAALANTLLAHARKSRLLGQKTIDVRHKAMTEHFKWSRIP